MTDRPVERVLVIVPFPMSADNLLLRQAQTQGMAFGPGITSSMSTMTAKPATR